MTRPARRCKVRGCGRPPLIRKHGLCGAHYKRWQRTGDVGAAKVQLRAPRRILPPYPQAPEAT